MPVAVQCIGDVPATDILVVTDAADNCSVPTVAFVSDSSDGNTCPEIITRTYSVTDACGNTINVMQTITVDDTINPTASNPVTTIMGVGVAAPAVDITVVIDAADNCTVTPVVAFVSESSDGGSCPEIITRIYSVTDNCGNSINVTHLIETTTLPVFNTLVAAVTPICAETDAEFLLTGAPGGIVTYSVDGGVDETVTLDVAGNGTVTVVTLPNSTNAVNVQIVLSNIQDGTTGCDNPLTDTATIVVNPNPVIDSITNNSDICALSDAIFEITGTADSVVTYSVDGGAAQTVTLDGTGVGQVIVPTVQNNTTVVNVVLTLSDIADPITGCNTVLTNTSTVVANPNPLPNAVADMEECDVDVNGEPDLDGLVVFDLASNTNAISNGLGNVSVSYYTALDGTGYPINQVADATAYTNDPILGTPQPIYVLVVNNDTGCYGVSSFNLIVNTVTFTPALDLFACDDDNDTFGYFDLAAAELQIIGGATNIDVTFHETLAEAEVGVGVIATNVLYQNVETDIPGVQTLYINVTDTDTGCSYTAETIC